MLGSLKVNWVSGIWTQHEVARKQEIGGGLGKRKFRADPLTWKWDRDYFDHISEEVMFMLFISLSLLYISVWQLVTVCFRCFTELHLPQINYLLNVKVAFPRQLKYIVITGCHLQISLFLKKKKKNPQNYIECKFNLLSIKSNC